MARTLLAVFLLLAAVFARAQNAALDSLRQASEKQTGKQLALTYLRLSLQYYDKNNFDAGLVCIERADSVAMAIKHDSLSIAAAYLRGTFYAAQGRRAEAIAVLERDITRAVNRKDTLQQLNFLRRLAVCYVETGQLDEARRKTVQGLFLAEAAHDLPRIRMFLERKGQIEEMQLEFREARQTYDKLMATIPPGSDQKFAARAYQVYCRFLIRAGDPEKAMAVIQRAFAIAKMRNDSAQMADNWKLKAAIYSDKLEYDSSRLAGLESARINQALGDDEALANDLLNLSASMIEKGDLREASFFLDSAYRLSNQLALSQRMLNIIQFDYGELYLIAGDYARARQAFKSSLASDLVMNPQSCWETYLRLDELYRKMNMPDSALYFNRLSTQNDSRNFVFNNAYVQRAHIFMDIRQADSARIYLNRARAYFGNDTTYTPARYHMAKGRFEMLNKRFAVAVTQYRRAIPKLNFWDKLDALHGLYQCHKALGDPVRALHALEEYQALSQQASGNLALYHQHTSLARYRAFEKDQENNALRLGNELHQATIASQRNTIYVSLAIVALLALLAYISYHNQRQKTRLNNMLHEKNEATERQRQRAEAALGQLQAAEAQLVQSEKMASIGQMMAGIAHEINNPINFVHAGSTAIAKLVNELQEALKRDGAVSHAVAELAEEIRSLTNTVIRGSERTSTIVRALLKLSHSNPEALSPVNLAENLDLALVLLAPQIKDRIVVQKEIGDVPPVTANQAEINQVLINLLQNSIHAVANGGVIVVRITLSAPKDHVVIEIVDNGSGIAPEHVSRIFDPFFTTKEVGKGTGLGLSIVHSIIKKHNGNIQVESTPGKGTRFIIELPTDTNP